MPLEFADGLIVDVVPPSVPVVRIAPPDNSLIVMPTPGPAGPAGAPGDFVGQIRLQAVAATVLSGHRIVTPLPDGTLVYASNTNIGHLHSPLWLTLGAVMAGAEVEVLTYGIAEESSWSWTPGPLYLGANGLITQAPPTSPSALFIVQIGIATGPTSVWVDRRSSIRLI